MNISRGNLVSTVVGVALLLVGVIVTVLFTTDSAQAKEVTKDFAETFDVRPGMTLKLDHGDGDVSIEPADNDVLDITVRYRVEHARIGVGDKANLDVKFDRDDDVIRVVGKEKGGFVIGFSHFKRYEYTYTITAPPYLILELRGEDGDVSIRRWTGNIACTLDDGDVTLHDIEAEMTTLELEDGDLQIEGLRGELDVQADDGDLDLLELVVDNCNIDLADGEIQIDRSEGVFDLETEDGNIEIRRTQATRLTALAEDGDIELDLEGDGPIDLDLESEDGDIDVDLAANLSADFSIETSDGRIRLHLPDEAVDVDRKRRASGQLGDGGGRIRIQTDDGNVTLRSGR